MASCFVIGSLKTIFVKIAYAPFYEWCKEKKNINLRIAKTEKAAEHMFKGLYFTTTTIVGTYVLRRTKFLPTFMMLPGLERSTESS